MWRSEGTGERLIPAGAEEIYAVITDVTSTGERSDECRSAEWLAQAVTS